MGMISIHRYLESIRNAKLFCIRIFSVRRDSNDTQLGTCKDDEKHPTKSFSVPFYVKDRGRFFP